MKNIKTLINKLEKLVELTNEAEEKWEVRPEDAKLEAAFVRAYAAEGKTREELAVAISNYAGIDTKIAYKMTYKTFEQLKNLAARM